MSNKVIGDYTPALTIDGATHYLLIQPGTSSTPYRSINRNVFLGVSGQPADLTTVQTFSNKVFGNTNAITLKDSLFTLQDDADTTKRAQFQLSGITTGTTCTYTVPNATTTLVGRDTTDTLTNKTLTAPVINGGTIDNSTITVDSIGEHTLANGVTIDGLNIKDGILNTSNSVVTSNITDAAVTPAKLLAGTGSGWAWQSWTPTWTNVTVGNGTVVARYIQIGKTVIARVQLLFGTTTAVTGAISLTLPITAASNYAAADILGEATLLDATGQINDGRAFYTSTTTTSIFALGASSTWANYVASDATNPFTWAVNDRLTISFTYEAA